MSVPVSERSELFDDVLALSIARDDTRPDLLLRVIVDSFVRETGPRRPIEVRQFEELAGHLAERVSRRTRAIVAEKLAGRADVPGSLRVLLGESSPAPEQAPAAAERPALPPEPVAPDLFALAPAERRAGLVRLSLLAVEPPLPAPAPEAIGRLMRHAVLRRRGDFARDMGETLGLAPELAARVADDPGGEPLVVAARALGLGEDALAQLLLLLNPAIGESYEKVVRLRELFRHLSAEAAAAVVARWRAAPRAQARHAPHFAPERRPADPAQARRPAEAQATSAASRK